MKCPKEVDGKSTAIHAKVIAPDDVRIFTYPDMPEYLNLTKDEENSNDKEVVLFLFPGMMTKKKTQRCLVTFSKRL